MVEATGCFPHGHVQQKCLSKSSCNKLALDSFFLLLALTTPGSDFSQHLLEHRPSPCAVHRSHPGLANMVLSVLLRTFSEDPAEPRSDCRENWRQAGVVLNG